MNPSVSEKVDLSDTDVAYGVDTVDGKFRPWAKASGAMHAPPMHYPSYDEAMAAARQLHLHLLQPSGIMH
jgi:hypothetical protein